MRDAGFDSYYWSATTYPDATGAYLLVFNSTIVFPSYYHARFVGFSVRGGVISLYAGSLRDASFNSFYWSATTYSNAILAYGLSFGSTSSIPSGYNNRFYGFSVRGGHVAVDAGSLRLAGFSSLYWSSTTYPNTTYAYDLSFYSTDVYQSHYNSRFYGFSVRGGDVNLSTGSLRYADVNSLYWSATTYPNATHAYYLDFNSASVLPSHYNNRFDGFSVRGGAVHLNTGSLWGAGGNSNYWSATTYPDATHAYHLHFNSTNVIPSYYNLRFYSFSVRNFQNPHFMYAAGTSL